LIASLWLKTLTRLGAAGAFRHRLLWLVPRLTSSPCSPLTLRASSNSQALPAGAKKGIKQLVEYYKKNVCNSGFSNYCVLGHADCVKDLHKLKDELLKIDQSIIFVESNVGPVIGSHVGPGMLACVFWNANKAQNMSVAEKIAKRVAGGI
jgi:hypothetical protein